MDLATKYRPKTFSDLTEQKAVVEILENICKLPELVNRNFLFIGPAGTGKAQPLDSSVLTVHGYRLMRDIKVGDSVFTANGNVANVSGVYPQGDRDVYRITLKEDNVSFEVADNHLNEVYWYNQDKKKYEYATINTLDLIDLVKTSRWNVRVALPEVNWPEQPTPIDPYLLGAFIGDGSLHGNFAFSNVEVDVINKVNSILKRDWLCELKSTNNKDWGIHAVDGPSKYIITCFDRTFYTWRSVRKYLIHAGYPDIYEDTLRRIADGHHSLYTDRYPELQDNLLYRLNTSKQCKQKLRTTLEQLGICVTAYNKYIPKQYLYNSRSVRLKLLQGLFDTDGYSAVRGDVHKSHKTEYSTSSKQLADDVAFLCRSLGMRVKVCSYMAAYKQKNEVYKQTHPTYLLCIRTKQNNIYDICSSKKHMSHITPYQRETHRTIKSIEFIGKKPCKCIMVNHTDHTYITDGFVPTHNTTLARIMNRTLNNGESEAIEVDAASYSGVESTRELVKQMKSYPLKGKYKVFILDEVHSFSTQSWQVLLKPIEEPAAKTVICLCTTNPEKIPATILSRVQTFQLSKISLQGIESRLEYILDNEGYKEGSLEKSYTKDAVTYIAKLAKGGMRDSITLLTKVLAYSNEVNMDNVKTALNLPNYDTYFELLNALVSHSNEVVVATIDSVYNSGVNFVEWFAGFHSFLCNIVKYICMKDISKTMIPSMYQDKIAKYGSAHLAVCLRLSQKLLEMIKDLKGTQYLQETAITYLCTVPKKGK